MNHPREELANLLANHGYCESCRRIPTEFREWISLEPDGHKRKYTYHATLSDLESAANEGCKICKAARERWQDVSRWNPSSKTVSCHRSFNRDPLSNQNNFSIDIDGGGDCRFHHGYRLKPIAGKLPPFVNYVVLRSIKQAHF